MAIRHWYGVVHPGADADDRRDIGGRADTHWPVDAGRTSDEANPGTFHHVGYCCVFLAAAYVIGIVLFVLRLLVSLVW